MKKTLFALSLLCAATVALAVTSVGTRKITVTTCAPATATRVDTGSFTNGQPRIVCTIVNQGANDGYYGFSSAVTVSTGVLLKAGGGSRNLDGIHHDAQLWVISTAGTTVGCEEGWQQ